MIGPTPSQHRHVRAAFAALALVTMALALAACSSGSGDLTGKTWQLTAITEKTPAFQGVVPPADQGKYTIEFKADGTFSAKADCNLLGGTYKTDKANLTITPGPSTLMACPDGSYGDLYAHALSQAASYAIANDQLTITLKDGGTLAFVAGSASSASAAPSASASAEPAPASSPIAGLTGKTWELVAITEKVPAFQGVIPPADAGKYTIEFKADGTFSAKADCNQVAGTYTATATGEMTITPGPSTLVACAEGSLGDLYVLGLTNTTGYAITDALLTLNLADQGTLQFK
jgi:heat shock protein HslJ